VNKIDNLRRWEKEWRIRNRTHETRTKKIICEIRKWGGTKTRYKNRSKRQDIVSKILGKK
jgi:hypothetical protein